MSTYRIYVTNVVSGSVEVEAETLDAAVDLAYDELPTGFCAHCSGWNQKWSLDLGGQWVSDDEYEVDGKYVDGVKS